jgi:hypothetical protein
MDSTHMHNRPRNALKHEIPNPKHQTNTNAQISKFQTISDRESGLGNLKFEFRICLGFRYQALGFYKVF